MLKGHLVRIWIGDSGHSVPPSFVTALLTTEPHTVALCTSIIWSCKVNLNVKETFLRRPCAPILAGWGVWGPPKRPSAAYLSGHWSSWQVGTRREAETGGRAGRRPADLQRPESGPPVVKTRNKASPPTCPPLLSLVSLMLSSRTPQPVTQQLGQCWNMKVEGWTQMGWMSLL